MARPRFVLFVVAFLALMVASEAVVVAATIVTKSGGSVTAVRTATAGGDNSAATTQLANFYDIDGMSVSMPVPAGQKALLVITFSANMLCATIDPTYDCEMQVLIDNNVAQPGVIQVPAALSGEDATMRSMQFVAQAGAGTHTVKVQWRMKEVPTGTFYAYNRTLTVLRSKI